MEGAIQTIVKVFLKSSKGKEGLGKKEFQNLVSSQLGNILTDTDSKEAINKMGEELDGNQDGKVGFEEFLKLVGYVACSLSEQRSLSKEETAQNSASAPNKEEQKPEANEEAKAAAIAEVKVEANADANAEVKVEAKAEGPTQPKAAKEEPALAAGAAVVAAATDVAATAGEVAAKVEKKVEEAADKPPAAEEEEVEKKTEEVAS